MSNTNEEDDIDSRTAQETKTVPKSPDKPLTEKEMEDRAAAVIVKLVSLSSETHPLAQKSFLAYKFGASMTTNIANLGKPTRAEALEAAVFLGLMQENHPSNSSGKRPAKNRQTLSHRIIKKIESLFPARCSDCLAIYQPEF